MCNSASDFVKLVGKFFLDGCVSAVSPAGFEGFYLEATLSDKLFEQWFVLACR